MVFPRRCPVPAVPCAILAAGLLAGPMQAQEPPPDEAAPLREGSRVRVTTDDGAGPITGWIDARTGDGFRLVRASDHTVVPLSTEAIRRLEVSRVRRSSTEQAVPGMVAGGLLGLVLGVALTEEHSCEPDAFLCFDVGSEKLLAGLAGAGLGVLGGGLLSMAVVPAESWTDVPPVESALWTGARGPAVALVVSIPGR